MNSVTQQEKTETHGKPKQCKSKKQIAHELNISPATLRRWARRDGIEERILDYSSKRVLSPAEVGIIFETWLI